MKRKQLAYYISAHGYGHGVRSTDIIRAICDMYPGIDVHLITDLPEDFLRSRVDHPALRFRKASFDVGMVQLDSIKVDLEATLGKVQDLFARREFLLNQEAEFLRRQAVDLVVSDIPALPMEAGKQAGLPVLAVGNFGWDWIYEEFAASDPRWMPLVEGIRAGYRQADLLLRLPFSEAMAAFQRRADIPVVARPGRERRRELAVQTGARPGKTWALLSFTSLDWDEAALKRVAAIKDTEFFTVKPLEWGGVRNIHAIDRHRIPFADVVASVDVVVTKPGFGILSECVVNRKPIIYSDRSDFREYAVLVQSVEKYLRHQHVPRELLYRGELADALRQIAGNPEPTRSMKAGGAEVAAHKITSFLR